MRAKTRKWCKWAPRFGDTAFLPLFPPFSALVLLAEEESRALFWDRAVERADPPTTSSYFL